MAVLKALDLEERLHEAVQAPVCALVGDDYSLRSYALRMLKDAAAPASQPGSTVREFEGVPQARDVFDELNTIPFLGLEGRRVVVVHNGDEFLRAQSERLLGYLKQPSRTGTLILCLSKLESRKRRKAGKATEQGDGASDRAKILGQFVRAIRAKGVVVDCSPLKWRDAERWVRARAAQMGLRFTPRAAAALMGAVGANLLGLESEMGKLASYCGAQATITERDVGEVVPAGRSRSVFDLSNAVCGGNAAEALRLCGRLLLRGESREGIIALLARQVRRLWQVKRLLGQGASEREIARQLNMPDFAVRQSVRLLDGLTEDWFARQLRVLSAADYESKVTSLRSSEGKVWLEHVLARMCQR